MEKLKRVISVIWIMLIFVGMIPTSVLAQTNNNSESNDVFFDDFLGDTLDGSKWLVAEKAWGGNNGGVVPQNVSVSNGTLKLEGHGNYYKGDVKGYNREDGIRTGAAIATREYYSSGSYEVVAKVAPVFGACSAIWTFEYEEYYPGDPEYIAAGATGSYYEVNHEIDIEMPGRPSSGGTPSFDYALCNTFVRENTQTTNFTKLDYAQNDGNWHKYRFDWHTGDDNETPRVEYFVDDKLVKVCTTNIPTNAGRFWIGIWFPCAKDSDKDGISDTGWTGTANFDTAIFEIDSVKITPFHEAGDTEQKETYGKNGWAVDSFPEDIVAESYDHIVNGDFSDGTKGWTLNGDASVSDGKGNLSSGSKTDTISQIVSVKPKMTYTITADVETDGTAVTIGARKKNGKEIGSKTVTESGKVVVTFETGTSSEDIKAFVEVLRYQTINNKVKVDNITFYPGKGEITEDNKPGDNSGEETPPSEDNGDENKDPEEPNPNVENLVLNGDFSKRNENWKVSGGTTFDGNYAILRSGSDTDTISQNVNVKRSHSYVLTADVITDGAEVTIGVKDYDGRYTEKSKTVSKSGKVKVEFTTADHIDLVSVFAQVLRYQSNSNNVYVDNICLVEATSNDNNNSNDNNSENNNENNNENKPNEEVTLPSTSLIVNGGFNGKDGWTTSGSAKIENGKAILASGRDTDKVKQTVKVKPNTKYRLSADINSKGATVDLTVSGYNGKYTDKTSSYSNRTRGVLVFTTGDSVKEVTVYAQVLRYQDNKEDVTIDNMVLEEVNDEYFANIVTTSNSQPVKTEISIAEEITGQIKLDIKELEISGIVADTEESLKKVYDISLLDENNEIVKVSDNELMITIDLDEELLGYDNYKVAYIKDGRIKEVLDAEVKDGKLTFVTTHLSNYGILAYNNIEEGKSPETGDLTINYIILAILSMVVLTITTKRYSYMK